MIEHIWSVACMRSMIDKDSNNLSLYEVFEQLSAEVATPRRDYPGGRLVLPIEFEIVSLWVRTNPAQSAMGVARYQVEAPGAASITIGDPIDIDLAEHERTRTRSRFSGLPVEESGRYWYIVQQQKDDDWIEVARLPLQIEVKFAETTPASD